MDFNNLKRYLEVTVLLGFSVALAQGQSPGDVDLSFNPGAENRVAATAGQLDGKLIIGGNFGTLAGGNRPYCGRLNTNLTLDTGFNPVLGGSTQCVVVQLDGKIVIGGGSLLRVNPDGSVDPGFNPSVNGLVEAVAIQPDGKVVSV